MSEDDRPPKLNIFALPNQTAILVILLTCVLYGTLIAIGASAQSIVFRLLTLGLLVLSLRGLLSWPERECAQNKLVLAGQEFRPIQELITRLASDLKLPRIPLLMLSRDDELHMFGSWRRWYITMGEDRARVVLKMLREDTDVPLLEAAMLHELCHFRNRDHLWTGYARALLRTGFWMMVWATVMLVGILGLLGLAQQAIFETHSPVEVARRFDTIIPGMGQPISSMIFGSTETWQRAREQAARIDLGQALFNQFINTFPLALFGGGLLLIFWQRLMRIREIYADAGVAQVQGRIGLLLKSIGVFSGATVAAADPTSAPRPFTQAIIEQARTYWLWIRNSLVRYYLGLMERWEYLREPQRIYGGWRRNALLIGFFTLVLDLAFAGTSALFYLGEWPLHFPILAAYILIVLALLTPIAIGQPVWRDTLKIAGVVTLIRFVLLLVSLTILIVGFVLFPTLLARLIDVWARALAGSSSLAPYGMGDDLGAFVLKATRVNLLQIPVVFVTLLLMVWFSAALARRILTWYRFSGINMRLANKIQTPMHVIYLTLVLLIILLAFAVLPLLTDLVVERLSLELVLSRLAVAAVSLLIVLPIAVWLWRLDRRHARRCPSCGETIPGYYWLGRACDRCGQVLNPWLLANYNTGIEP